MSPISVFASFIFTLKSSNEPLKASWSKSINFSFETGASNFRGAVPFGSLNASKSAKEIYVF